MKQQSRAGRYAWNQFHIFPTFCYKSHGTVNLCIITNKIINLVFKATHFESHYDAKLKIKNLSTDIVCPGWLRWVFAVISELHVAQRGLFLTSKLNKGAPKTSLIVLIYNIYLDSKLYQHVPLSLLPRLRKTCFPLRLNYLKCICACVTSVKCFLLLKHYLLSSHVFHRGAGFVQSREEAFKHTALVDLSTKIRCCSHNVRLETRTFRLNSPVGFCLETQDSK